MKVQITQSKVERTLKMLILLLAFMALYLSSRAQEVSTKKTNIGLIYPVSTNGTHAAADINVFSFNLLAGVSAAEEGFTFAGFSNVVHHDARGMQFAGFSNHIGGKAEGLMFSGFMNTYKGGKGLAFAGFTNLALKNIEGSQFAGFLNRAADVEGTQLAGFSNVGKRVRGTQVAGFSNTAGDVKGSQIAGFINVAKKVKGVQLAGFINIADSSDHSVAIINIIKNGEKSFGLSVDESRTAMASFRSGGRVLYGIIGAGYNFKNEEEVYAFELGLGAHMIYNGAFRVNAELSVLSLESFWSGEYFKNSLKLIPAIRPSKHIEIFGGPVFNYVNTNSEEGRVLTSKYIRTWENRWGNNFQGIYVGYTAGLNIVF